MKNKVICIGQALVDCITRGKEPWRERVYRAQSISLNTGGDALNEASLLAKMGIPVSLVCGLGEDVAGNLVYQTALERGIDVSHVSRLSKLATPIANLTVHPDGSRESCNSEATMLTGYIPDPSVVHGASVVSLASLFRAPLDQKETVIHLAREAKKAGAILCADTKIPTFRQLTPQDISEILPLIDYLFPNENEAALFTGKQDYMEMAEALHAMGIRTVIVKAGKDGCYACSDTERFHMPALPVKAIDSTGAGDSFVAGFIAGLLEQKSLWECCEKGTKCAAECVGHAGAV